MDLGDDHLRFHNFEWLASSCSSLGTQEPRMVDGIVRIPIHFDDFPLFAQNVAYEVWEKRALALIAKRNFVAFGLHDCYGEYWLPRNEALLAKIAAVAEIRTFDDVAAQVVLASSR